ncbi:hypothetical protein [Celeribacter baekdonensis]|uniref:O-antigen polymerase n=1 Tax=Celeribacter baekdonensis B30 TaxID=1208323 RepID=K2KAF3_9RHOB|nr:hypothetical protein [Celeribacter baekdonensis]EKE74335.1 hypothetical protein B30_01375 [Celeribacter baekdonensis B30]
MMKTVLLTMSLFGLYTLAPLGIPFGVYLLPGLVSLVLYLKSQKLFFWLLSFCGVLLALFIFNVLLRGGATEIGPQFVSLTLFFLTVSASTGFLLLVLNFPPRTIHKWSKLLIWLILVGLFLERVGPLKPVSDFVRGLLYSSELVYGNDLRDMTNYGFIRPKLFASEPSHVAKFFGMLLVVAVTTSTENFNKSLILIWSVAFVVLEPSVTAAPGIAVTVSLLVFQRQRLRTNGLLLKTVAVSGIGAGLFVVALQMITRLGFDGTPIEASAYIRIVEPAFMAVKSLAERPFLGFGVGVEEDIFHLINQIRGSATPLFVLTEKSHSVLAGNVFFSMFWQYGIVGTVLIWFFILKLVSMVSKAHFLFVILFIIIHSFSVADIHTPFFWGYFVMVLAGFWHLKHTQSLQQATQSELGIHNFQERKIN